MFTSLFLQLRKSSREGDLLAPKQVGAPWSQKIDSFPLRGSTGEEGQDVRAGHEGSGHGPHPLVY